MSGNIDNSTVQMTFDNAQFEAGIATSVASLAKLNQSLQLQGATKGLQDVGAAAGENGSALGILSSGVDGIADKFSTMSVIAISALASITSKIVDTGIELVKSFTIDPIKEGFDNYETQIGAIQTILANTAAAGTTLAQVNAVLKDLNTYANLTVYNFSQMAANIGTFTAAGVGLQVSVNAIKGIANLAAFSGSTSDQASMAMYQLSQAIAAGTVKLQDWNSVVNAGLGGKTFQDALINTARVNGVAIDQIIKQTGSFRNSLQKGWLTSDILTQTLSQFTGDLSLAQITAMGYTAAQAQQIFNLAQTAVNAATKIKTMTQLTEALKEEVSTAYAAIFTTIFGNITQATTLFSGIHTVAENALTGPIYALNALLQGWEALGGRDVLITTLSSAFKELGAVLKVVEEAFRDVFPPETAQQLYTLTTGLESIVDKFKMGAVASEELKQTFAGVFAVISIGLFVIKQIVAMFLNLFDQATQGSGQILALTGRVGDFLVRLQQMIESGHGVTDFFTDLTRDLTVPIQLIQKLTSYISALFEKFDNNKATSALTDISTGMGQVGKYSQETLEVWDKIVSTLESVGKTIDALTQKFGSFFKTAGTSGQSAFSVDFSTILNAIDTGLFAGLYLLVKKFVAHFKEGTSTTSEIIKTLTEPFEELTKTLATMQNTLKAATLLEIAAAILLLAVALGQLAVIPQQGLIQGSIAIGVLFTQLIASMIAFQKFVGTKGFLKMPFIMASMILLAAAIDVLASAVVKLAKLDWNSLAVGLTGLAAIFVILAAGLKLMGSPQGLILAGLGLSSLAGAIGGLVVVVTKLAGLSWDQLAKGLTGVGVLLLSLALFTQFADTGKAGAIRSTGIILLAAAMEILFNVVQNFSKLSWEEIGKGLTGIGATLLALALFTRFSEANKAGMTQGVGIVLLAAAIEILTQAVDNFANLSWDQIGKGLTGIAATLLALVLFTRFSEADKAGISQGAGIVLLASGIEILSLAIENFAKLSWEEIGKGISAMGAGLAIISTALARISPKSVISATAVVIVASSLWMISDAVKSMGALSWGTIGKGITALAGALIAIAASLKFLPPSTILSAGAIFIVAMSLSTIGAALAKMGEQSWTSIAKGLVELNGALATIAGGMMMMTEALPGAAALAIVAASLMLLVPVLVALGGMSWADIGKSLVALAAVFVVLGVAALIMAPIVPILDALGVAIALIGVGMLAAGLGLALFSEAMKNIGINVGLGAVSLAKEAPAIAAAVIIIVETMITTFNTLAPKVEAAVAQFILGIVNTMAIYVPKIAAAGIQLVVNLLNAVASKLGSVINAGGNIIISFLNGISAEIPKIIQAGYNLILNFINSLTTAINQDSGPLGTAAGNLAVAIIKGLVNGIGNGVGQVTDAAENLAKSALHSAEHFLGINSPSKKTTETGQWFAQGAADGMDNMSHVVDASATNLGKTALTALSKTMTGLSDLINTNVDVNPTITPVLDLSDVKKNASQISGMLTTKPISVGSSYSNAVVISAGQQANNSPDDSATNPTPPTAPAQTVFNQTINSPKAVSATDVYRNTKNLVSKQRGVLVYVDGSSD